VVLGGGAIGCEPAQVIARFGVRVTIVDGGDRLIAMAEAESSEHAAEALTGDGVGSAPVHGRCGWRTRAKVCARSPLR
jgi:pyruvate/2-oxoglutarate dehydrogenase complex dihydrolipoamide dehydrogenase (E3) component